MTRPAKIQSLPAVLLLFLQLSVPLLLSAQSTYQLHILAQDQPGEEDVRSAGIQTSFLNRADCEFYLIKLPATLRSKGFVTASVDSVHYDSLSAQVKIYFGKKYQWSKLDVSGIDEDILSKSGWRENLFERKPMDFQNIISLQNRMLSYLENNGYPFGKIYLDSIMFIDDSIHAKLVLDPGPLYRIDSIRIFGEVRISNLFLQRYLDIHNGSIYDKRKLSVIPAKIRELGYVEEERPFDLNLLGTGSVLNLYLKPRKSSQVNALVGFLPNNDQLASKKILVTGEANIFLRNAFGGGENIGLNWQQLQVKSPRLNLFYRQPYVFRSPYGLDFSFDMFRKDSSFLNIIMNLGASYTISASQTGKIFLRNFQTIISQGGINEAQIISGRRLPDIADMSSLALGAELERNNTDYRLNPRRGLVYSLGGSAGTKKIRKNNEITDLKDPGDPSFDFGSLYDTVKLKSYQLRLTGSLANYWPVGRQGTFKTAMQTGFFFSDDIFRNELFQVGGYKLLRGFDEESQYVSQYAVATLEYRLLIGLNSYFFGFLDGGWAKNNSRFTNYSHTYLGTGLGLAFETKAGIFNLAWAVGQRNDIPFNLRQSKIHVGFVNYF